MAGLGEIVQRMHPRCPHCHHALDLTEFASELFAQILDALARGDRVLVAHFGTFAARRVASRTIQSFDGPKEIAARTLIRFRTAAHAKETINAQDAGGVANEQRRLDSRAKTTEKHARRIGSVANALVDILGNLTEELEPTRVPSPEPRGAVFGNPTRARKRKRRSRPGND